MFNNTNTPATPSKRLWVEGTYSRFVRPGYVRIGATAAPATGVSVSAYYGATDNKVVIVAINTNNSASSQAFTLAGVTGKTVTPWVTDGTRNIASQSAITPTGNGFPYSLPSQSVTSLVVDLVTTGIRSVQAKDAGQPRVLRGADGYRVDLPSGEACRVELLTSDGRMLDSRSVPAGEREFNLGTPKRTGLLIVKVVQGAASWTAEFVNH